jgi:hypothetical protein
MIALGVILILFFLVAVFAGLIAFDNPQPGKDKKRGPVKDPAATSFLLQSHDRVAYR